MINTSRIKSGRQRVLKTGEPCMIPNYKTSETQRNRDGAVLYKNEQWQQQLQKEIGVTKLAGGIAHHFNNLLTIVIGYGTLLQMKMEPDNPLRIYVEHILSSSEMAADLTKKLLILSGEHKMSLRIANLNETVRGVERHLPLFINNNIKLQVKLSDRDLPVMIDESHFEEALVDLIINAVDAMPLGGTLTVTTELLTFGSDLAAARKGIGRSKERALLTVSDTGFGMTQKVKERVFDPFFTTKEVGKGMGLGLSTVYGTVKMHNGTINIESQLGQGTKVNIYLPLLKPEIVNTMPIPLACHMEDKVLSDDVLRLKCQQANRKPLKEEYYEIEHEGQGGRCLSRSKG
jgi:hypothetical protein